MAEILNSLIHCNINIKEFSEFDFSPFDCFENMIEINREKFVFKHIQHSIPILYRIVGQKCDNVANKN